MDIETKIWIALMAVYAIGCLCGWYLTYEHFRKKEIEREAVDEYKRDRRLKQPPTSFDEMQRRVLSDLQRFCTSYIVEYEDKKWTYGDTDDNYAP